MKSIILFYICLSFLYLLSSSAQSKNDFNLGVSAGYAWASFTPEEFAEDFNDYGEHHQYEFGNSYVVSLNSGYFLLPQVLIDLKILYMPCFTTTYEERDQNDDILLGDYKVKYFLATIGIKYLLQSNDKYTIAVGCRGGMIHEQKDITFSFRANMEIHSAHKLEEKSQDGFCANIFLEFQKQISSNFDLAASLSYERILSESPKTKFTVFEAGVIYRI